MAMRAAAPSLRQMRAVWHFVSGPRVSAAAPRRLGRLQGGVAARRTTVAGLEPLRSSVVSTHALHSGPASHGPKQQRRSVSASVAVPAEQASAAGPTEQQSVVMTHKLVTFYAFPKGGIADPKKEVEAHKEFCKVGAIRLRSGPPFQLFALNRATCES